MRGKVKCASCGHVFEIGEAHFNFDLSSSSNGKSEMRCPKCKGDDIVPVYTK
ncbi:MAG: hypothetical protein Q6373_017830 [Candidatus Sigynarchaeota archaeon]